MLLNIDKISEYILQAAAIALISRYFLGRTPLDRGLFILIISIVVSQFIVDIWQGVGFSIGRELVGQKGGSMGLHTAIETQRTLKQSGGGLQSALGIQGTLRQDRDRTGEIHEHFVDSPTMDKVMPYDGKNNSAPISFDTPITRRLDDFLYSEDIISIGSGESRLALLDGSNYIQVIPKTGLTLNDRLFKLRFKVINSKSGERPVIKYGDPVLIQYSDDAAQTKMLNHDGHLNILQNNRDVIFRLFCTNSEGDYDSGKAVDIRRKIKKTDRILIGCAEDSYLKIDRDRVTITANEYEATLFDISIKE